MSGARANSGTTIAPILQDIVVATKSLDTGEFQKPANNIVPKVEMPSVTIDRLHKQIINLADQASDKHRVNCVAGSNQLLADKKNNITRLITNEFFFYTQQPLALAEFETLMQKIAVSAKQYPENFHLLLGSFAVRTPDNKVMNVVPQIESGKNPQINLIVKNHPSSADPVYVITNQDGSSTVLPNIDIQKPNNVANLSVAIDGKANAFSFNNIINCQTAGNTSFLSCVDICLDHLEGVAKNNLNNTLVQSLTNTANGRNNEKATPYCAHTVISNFCFLAKENCLGNVTHADPISSHANCKQNTTISNAENLQKVDFGVTASMITTPPVVCNQLPALQLSIAALHDRIQEFNAKNNPPAITNESAAMWMRNDVFDLLETTIQNRDSIQAQQLIQLLPFPTENNDIERLIKLANTDTSNELWRYIINKQPEAQPLMEKQWEMNDPDRSIFVIDVDNYLTYPDYYLKQIQENNYDKVVLADHHGRSETIYDAIAKELTILDPSINLSTNDVLIYPDRNELALLVNMIEGVTQFDSSLTLPLPEAAAYETLKADMLEQRIKSAIDNINLTLIEYLITDKELKDPTDSPNFVFSLLARTIDKGPDLMISTVLSHAVINQNDPSDAKKWLDLAAKDNSGLVARFVIVDHVKQMKINDAATYTNMKMKFSTNPADQNSVLLTYDGFTKPLVSELRLNDKGTLTLFLPEKNMPAIDFVKQLEAQKAKISTNAAMLKTLIVRPALTRTDGVRNLSVINKPPANPLIENIIVGLTTLKNDSGNKIIYYKNALAQLNNTTELSEAVKILEKLHSEVSRRSFNPFKDKANNLTLMIKDLKQAISPPVVPRVESVKPTDPPSSKKMRR